MVYTKEELINAFCELKEYNGKDSNGDDISKLEFITNIESMIQERIDARLAEFPSDAREVMKKQAIKYLVDKEAEQLIIDNEVVDF